MSPYTQKCHECESLAESLTLGKAQSDASWHNTMSGHDAYVIDEDNGSIIFDFAEIAP